MKDRPGAPDRAGFCAAPRQTEQRKREDEQQARHDLALVCIFRMRDTRIAIRRGIRGVHGLINGANLQPGSGPGAGRALRDRE